MPTKIRPDDWDRLFAPNAPRRGGPLQIFITILIAAVFIGVLGGGGVYLFNYRQTQTANINATQTAVAPTSFAIQTATIQARADATATVLAQQTATAQVPQGIGVGVVVSGGNLRSEPRVAPETVVGLLAAGDQITFLEEQLVGGDSWFRIRVTAPAAQRDPNAVAVGSEGWASASLLSPPTPAP